MHLRTATGELHFQFGTFFICSRCALLGLLRYRRSNIGEKCKQPLNGWFRMKNTIKRIPGAFQVLCAWCNGACVAQKGQRHMVESTHVLRRTFHHFCFLNFSELLVMQFTRLDGAGVTVVVLFPPFLPPPTSSSSSSSSCSTPPSSSPSYPPPPSLPPLPTPLHVALCQNPSKNQLLVTNQL